MVTVTVEMMGARACLFRLCCVRSCGEGWLAHDSPRGETCLVREGDLAAERKQYGRKAQKAIYHHTRVGKRALRRDDKLERLK